MKILRILGQGFKDVGYLLLKILRILGQGFKDVGYLLSQMEMYLLCWLDASTSFPWIEIYMIFIWSIFIAHAFQWYLWYPIVRKV